MNYLNITLVALSLFVFTACDNARVVEDKINSTVRGTTPQFPINRAKLSFTPTPLAFGGVLVGSTSKKTVTVKNVGGLLAFGVASSIVKADKPVFTFTGGAYPGTAGTCSDSIDANAECTLEISFAPTSNVDSNFNLSLNYRDNGPNEEPYVSTLPISGTGTIAPPKRAKLVFQTNPLAFGNVAFGSSKTLIVKLKNTGAGEAKKISSNSTDTNFSYTSGSFPGKNGDCRSSLASNATCSVEVKFEGKSEGQKSATFTVNYKDEVASASTDLSLTAKTGLDSSARANIVFIPTSKAFGDTFTGETKKALIKLKNIGERDAKQLQSINRNTQFEFTGGSYPGTGGVCSTELKKDETCFIEVSFKPTSVGNHAGSFKAEYSDAIGSLDSTLTVSGKGMRNIPGRALITITPASKDFGELKVGQSRSATFTLTNIGHQDASITKTELVGQHYVAVGGNCGTTLEKKKSCNIEVAYKPKKSGRHNSKLKIKYTDSEGASNVSATLTGTASIVNLKRALLTTNPKTVRFGKVEKDNSRSIIVVLKNTGKQDAQNISLVSSNSLFSFSGGSYPGVNGSCGTNLSVNDSCIMEIIFAPTAYVYTNASFVINYNDYDGALVGNLPVDGRGTIPRALGARLILTPKELAFKKVKVGESKVGLATIKNIGKGPATNLGSTSAGRNFEFNGGTFPGTRGTCTSTLAAKSECVVDIIYTPKTAEEHCLIFIFKYMNGPEEESLKLNAHGRGVL